MKSSISKPVIPQIYVILRDARQEFYGQLCGEPGSLRRRDVRHDGDALPTPGGS